MTTHEKISVVNAHNNSGESIFKSPFLWGGILTFGFYAAIHNGFLSHPQLVRYFSSHPVEYVITAMFGIGLASLVIRYLDVIGERQQLRKLGSVIEDRGNTKFAASVCSRDLHNVELFAQKNGDSTYTRRLCMALGFVQRSGNARELDSELRYLADEDAARTEGEYALVRMILWAVPMLGFLGTVIGITLALGNLDLTAINESSKMLSAGLSVAFDTTALAISLDILLYFIQFLTQREEMQLLQSVDRRTIGDLQGRYETDESTGQSELVTVRRMLDLMSRNLESILLTQSESWGRAARDLSERSSQLAVLASKQIQEAIASTLADAEAILSVQLKNTLHESLHNIAQLQTNAIRQTEILGSLTGTTKNLIGLEERINENLSSFAQVGKFEETINALSAVLHLLSAKVPQIAVARKSEAA